MTDKAPRTEAREAVLRFIPESWDGERRRNFIWRLDDYGREAAASPPAVDALDVERLTVAIRTHRYLLNVNERSNELAEAVAATYARLTESSDHDQG